MKPRASPVTSVTARKCRLGTAVPTTRAAPAQRTHDQHALAIETRPRARWRGGCTSRARGSWPECPRRRRRANVSNASTCHERRDEHSTRLGTAHQPPAHVSKRAAGGVNGQRTICQEQRSERRTHSLSRRPTAAGPSGSEQPRPRLRRQLVSRARGQLRSGLRLISASAVSTFLTNAPTSESA